MQRNELWRASGELRERKFYARVAARKGKCGRCFKGIPKLRGSN